MCLAEERKGGFVKATTRLRNALVKASEARNDDDDDKTKTRKKTRKIRPKMQRTTECRMWTMGKNMMTMRMKIRDYDNKAEENKKRNIKRNKEETSE